MIRKSINLILLIFSVNILFAQNTFEKLISDPEDQIINQVIEDGDGNFIFVGRIKNNQPVYYSGYLLKLSRDGQVLEEKNVNPNNRTSAFFDCHLINSNLYVVGGSNALNQPNDRKLWYLKYDNTSNLVDEQMFQIPEDRWISYMNSIIDSDTNLVITGYTTRNDTSPAGQPVYNLDPYFFKLSIDADSLTSNFMTIPGYLSSSYDILEKQDSSGYDAYVSYCSEIVGSSGQIMSLNMNFQNPNFDSIPLGIRDFYSPVRLNATDIILCGNGSPSQSALYALNVITINEQFELLNYYYFKKEDNMRDHPAMYNGISKNADNIYVGGTSNLDYSNPFYSSMDSWFHLIKINSDITPQWEYYYGGDAYYVLYSILATSDGGCLMVGNRYDDEIQNLERDVYIVKVNSDGLIVWTQEIEVNNNPSVVYPNPGTNSLQVKTYHKEWLVELFNINGQLMIKQQVNADENTIDTQMLNPGMYFYRLTDLKNKTVESGKWVKQ